MEKQTVQHLQQLNFVKEFCDPKNEPEAFYMRRNFSHQYLKGLHVLIGPEAEIEVWTEDCALEPSITQDVRLFKCKYSEQQLSRIINWIEK